MTKQPQIAEDILTVADIAALADGKEELLPETMRHLCDLVCGGALGSDQLREVQDLAEDAGLDPGSPTFHVDGLLINHEFDRLLAAEAWKDPAEILDPEGDRGVGYPPLIHIAARRADRAEDPSRLLEIHRALQCAALGL